MNRTLVSGSNVSAARVEFIFDRRADLDAKPDKTVAGYIYTRDGGQASYDQTLIFGAYHQPATVGQAPQLLPPKSATTLLNAFRAVDGSMRMYRFRYSAKAGFTLSPL